MPRPAEFQPPTVSGKAVIVVIAVVSLALAFFAWWRRYEQGREALAFWGVEQARLIRHAPRVELLRFAATSGPAVDASTGAPSPASEQRLDISRAPGLVHARHSLIVDHNFQWTSRPPPDAARWDYGLVFSQDKQRATVLFDRETGAVALLEPGGGRGVRRAVLSRPIADGMNDYLERRLADRQPSAPDDPNHD